MVEGCGLEEVNGAYKRDVTQSSPVFRNSVQSKEKIIVYNIFRVSSYAHSWIIASTTKGTCVRMDLYSTQTECISETSPKNGWNKIALGILPAPSCRVIP